MDIYQYISLCAFGSQRYSGNAGPLATCWCLKQFCSGARVWEQVFAVTTFPIYVVQRLDEVRIPVTTNGYISIYIFMCIWVPTVFRECRTAGHLLVFETVLQWGQGVGTGFCRHNLSNICRSKVGCSEDTSHN